VLLHAINLYPNAYNDDDGLYDNERLGIRDDESTIDPDNYDKDWTGGDVDITTRATTQIPQGFPSPSLI
jgi:hypothetical protein